MALEVVTVPCRSDNYAYLLRDEGSGQVALVDAPSVAPIVEALDALFHGVTRGQHQDARRRVGRVVAQTTAHFAAVHIRKPDIQDDDVMHFIFSPFDARRAIICFEHIEIVDHHQLFSQCFA